MEWRKKSQWNIAVFNNEKKLKEIFHYSDDDQYDYVRMEKLNDLFSYYNAIERQMSVKKNILKLKKVNFSAKNYRCQNIKLEQFFLFMNMKRNFLFTFNATQKFINNFFDIKFKDLKILFKIPAFNKNHPQSSCMNRLHSDCKRWRKFSWNIFPR